MLDIQGKRCVIIGGGPVALRRARALLAAGGEVTVISPAIGPELSALALDRLERPYRHGDLKNARLVIIASNNPKVNQMAAREAELAGVLVNRADGLGAGDFTVPAHERHGPVTLAVDTGGTSASAAAAIRRALSDALDPDWPRLIELASPFRSILRERFADVDQRHARLKRLADPQAMALLKDQGEEAVLDYFKALTQTQDAD